MRHLPLDNFYDNGISGVSDPVVKALWADMYAGPALGQLPWYVSLGNHDWYTDPAAELHLSATYPRWHIPARIYEHVVPFGAATAVFLVMDTSLLQYGYAQSPKMPAGVFAHYGLTAEAKAVDADLRWLEDRMQKYAQAEFLFVVGVTRLIFNEA